MPFAPGQSGNPEGRAASKPFLDSLKRAISQDDSKRLRKCAETLLDLAAAGESWAVQMLADRLDGKAVQRAEVTGEDGGPIYIKTGIDRILAEVAESADR